MLEAILTAGGTGKHYPNSGPGPQTLLFGDTDEGYFGRVPLNEMISNTELMSQMSVTRITQPTYWLKFYRKNEVLFIGVGGTLGTTWDTTYNSGLIYGIDNNGPFTSSTPTNQLRIVRQDKWGYLVRALRTQDDVSVTPITVPVAAEGAMLRKAFARTASGTQEWDNINVTVDTSIRERYSRNPQNLVLRVDYQWNYQAHGPTAAISLYPVLVLTSLVGRVLPVNGQSATLNGPVPISPTVTADKESVVPAMPLYGTIVPTPLAMPTATFTAKALPASMMQAEIPAFTIATPKITYTPNEG